jgi:hypothetical protein
MITRCGEKDDFQNTPCSGAPATLVDFRASGIYKLRTLASITKD